MSSRRRPIGNRQGASLEPDATRKEDRDEIYEEHGAAVIKNFARIDGGIIMQGVQADCGWTIRISEETGKMSASVAGGQVGFILFGACTAL